MYQNILIRVWLIIELIQSSSARSVEINLMQMKLDTVPQNLDENVEFLRLSVNCLQNLTSDSFKRYSKLKYLFLDRNQILQIAPDTFSSLNSLEVLHVDYHPVCDQCNGEKIHFPPNLRELHFKQNGLNSLGIADLEHLKKLSLTNSLLEDVPDLGGLVSIEELDLSDNPLTKFTVMSLKQFCDLRVVQFSKKQVFTHNLCACLNFDEWTREHRIRTMNFHRSMCKGSGNCGRTILNTNNQCAEKKIKTTITNWVIVIGCGILGVIFIWIVCWWILRRERIRTTKDLFTR